MGIDTHADWITGSYATDVQYLLEVAENNPLRSNPTLANLGPKLDSVQSVFIGYGYDLLQNAADAAGDLQDAGATIADPDGLKSLLEGLQAPLTPADVSDIASYISVANTPAAIAQFANSLLNSEIAIVEDQLSTFIQEKLGIAGDILPSNERVALMDLYYNDPGGEGKRGFFLNANGTLTHLSQALQAGNRAEAWFEIRYRSAAGGKQGLGLVSRRYVDAQLFGLYADSGFPTETESLQAYEMLTANRSLIMSYELRFGSDPYGTNALTTSRSIASANQTYSLLSGPNEVQTLAQVFDPAAEEEITYLAVQYAGVMPSIELNDAGGTDGSSFEVRSVDVYAASATDHDVDAMVSYAPLGEASVDDVADHILLGNETGDTLVGALGSDILVAQAGNELLESGAGADTLIANGGNDTIQAQGVSDVMDFVLPAGSSGYDETVELNSGASGLGELYMNGSQIGGELTASGQDTWTLDGNTYRFIPNPSNPPPGYSPGKGGPEVGELQIQLGGSQAGNEIDVWGFDLSEATSTTELGIHIPLAISVIGGSTAGIDPPTGGFSAGSSQSYTVAVPVPTASALTVTMALTGVPPTAFALVAGASLIPIGNDGMFAVTIPAGSTTTSFSLANTGDVGAAASLQLVASIPDPSDPTSDTISSAALTQSYVEPTDDPFSTPSTDTLYYLGADTTSGGLAYNSYVAQDGAVLSPTVVAGAGAGNNYIFESGEPNSSVNGGAGNDTIFTQFGYHQADGGVDVINGDGGQDDILAFGGASDGLATIRIYGNFETDLATAIADANTAAATDEAGDLIVTSDPGTVVGGNGNDLILTGDGGVVVAGPGNDTIATGAPELYTTTDWTGNSDLPAPGPHGVTWSTSFSNGSLEVQGGSITLGRIADAPAPSGYEGNYDDTGGIFATTNDTIFGGAGDDLIYLSNGNDQVHLGDGDSTVNGGMGSDTIFGGSGNDSIVGGGGSDYIAAGSGNDWIMGRGGNNTIFGGSGADTISAGGAIGGSTPEETGNDFVQAGSGNTLIFGSGGNDTLIGGSGMDTIQAGNGNESIVAGSGNTSINGGNGSDTIVAGSGSDTIWGSTQSTTIYGGIGVDSISGMGGVDVIYAGDGGTAQAATTITAGSGDTTIYGGEGVDQILGGSGNDVIYAGDGGTADTPTEVLAGSGDTTIYGGDGFDSIVGGSGTDVLYAGDGGDDTGPTYVTAGTGVATLYGGAGASILRDSDGGSDVLEAGSGDSTLQGSGQDTLIAGSGSDYLAGGANSTYSFGADIGVDEVANQGAETLVFDSSVDSSEISVSAAIDTAGDGALTIDEGEGSITVDGGLSSANVAAVDFAGSQSMSLAQLIQQEAGLGNVVEQVLAGTRGNFIFDASAGDSVVAGSGQDTISAWGDNDTLAAGDGGTHIYAEGNDDLVMGGSGNDTLIAGSGSDTLLGGSGEDTLIAGSGTDLLEGGTGNTTYVFEPGSGSAEIDPTKGSGMIQFGAGISPAGLTVGLTTASNGDPALLIEYGSGSITVDGGLTGSLGTFDFADGTQLSFAGLLTDATVTSSTLTGSSGNAIIDSSPAASLSGGSGQDTIIGTGASDTLSAGTSDEYLFAAGNDAVVNGGYGDDTLVGGGANDTLLAGNGDQQLYARGTGDLLVGGAGNDTLHGGSGSDTLIASTGSTIMYGGASGDSIVLTAGAAVTFYPSSTSATELIELPAGMTLADFTAYEGANGDLVLESLSGSTTAVIKGFYSGGSAGAVWMIADSSGQAQPLSEWLDSLEVQPPSGYGEEMDALRQSFAANLEGTLDQIGQRGGTIQAPSRTISRGPQYQYQFNGVSSQDSIVQGGVLTLGPSDDDQATSTTLQTGSTTYTVRTPVYGEVTVPGWQEFIPDSSLTQQQITSMENESADNGQGLSVQPGTDASGNPGFLITSLPSTEYVQTGTRATVETVPVYTTYTQEAQAFTEYNVTGDGGNDVITSSGPVVGTVMTGNGNVSVDLGMENTSSYLGHTTYNYPDALPPGAFIEAGSGIDTIVGTGGADVIAAGTGIDYIDAGLGSTVYVPMQGFAAEEIATEVPDYGSGPFPESTLVLPNGVTPQDLSYRFIDNWNFNADPLFDPIVGGQGPENWPTEALEITYGDSRVLVDFSSTEDGAQGVAGISQIQFADGTVLTRNQLIAMAGPAIAESNFNPSVAALNPVVEPDSTIAAHNLFSASDSSGSNVTWYQISDTGAGGAHFTLGGVTQSPGQTFYVNAGELSELAYVAGDAGSTDSIQVSAFDGVLWGAATSFNLAPGSGGSDQATGPNQVVTGSTSGPDTLVGGYGGDTLVGGSGQDTFEYNTGGGAEKISEAVSPSSTSANVVQFGAGITAGSVTLSANGDSELVLSIGSGDDSLSIEGFNVLDPLQSFPIQSFAFADGSSANLLQLLGNSEVAGSSGSITNADGSVTSYQFTPSDQQVYFAQTVDSSNDLTATISLNADGSQTAISYAYNADGGYSATAVSTPSGGGGSTLEVDGFNSQGQSVSSDITRPDGSTDDFTIVYHEDGTRTQTEVLTPAGGQPTTTVMLISSQNIVLSIDVTNPDGSTNDTTNTYNPDGSYTETQVVTPAGGGAAVTTIYDVNTQGQWTSVDITNADGSTDDSAYTYNSDGSSVQTEVITPAGGGSQITRVIDSNSQGQWTSVDVTNPDGSTVNSAYVYNPDGSYTETSVSTPAGGGVSTTTIADYSASGQLENSSSLYQADGANQEVVGGSSGPDIIVGCYQGDTLIGSSGQDTFDYGTGGGAEVISEAAPVSSASENVVQFGSGVAPSSISLSASGDQQLVLSLGDAGDSLAIAGFDPINPLQAFPIQSFAFADGTSLNLLQLLGDSAITGSSGSITNTDGSDTTYQFTPSGQQIYYAQTENAGGLLLESFALNSDGSEVADSYSYNTDGTYSKTDVSTPAAGGATTTVYGYDSSGDVIGKQVTDPDGSLERYTFNAQGQELTGDITYAYGATDNLSFSYNADGTYSETDYSTPAAGGTTVSVYNYDASGNELGEQDSYPDGSSDSETFNSQGQFLTYDYTSADGSTDNWTFSYNPDGTSSGVEVATPAGGGAATTTAYAYDASGNELSANVANPDGSTADWTYTYNDDGTSSAVEVSTPANGGASTTTTYEYDASGNELSANITNPDGSTELDTFNSQGQQLTANYTHADGSTADWTYTYNNDGTSAATELTVPAGGGAPTTTVYGYDSSGDMVSKQVTNPDGSSAAYTYGWEGLEVTADVTSADGSTSDSTYSYNSDGTYSKITVSTPAGGGGSTTTAGGYDASGNLLQEAITNPDGSLDRYTFNTQGQELTGDITNADGSTVNLSFSYNTDGTYTETKISTPASGGSTTQVYDYDASGNEVSEQDTYPDGSSESDTFNAQGQRLTADYTLADGSTNDWNYTYNADETSSATEVSTPAGGGASTTTVYQDDAQGNQLSQNAYTPGSDGSYTDVWSKADGSHGSYWWNASTSEYQETWYNSDGSNWTDDYQYANGGSPGATGYSFVETYSASDGSEGTRQYNASTGAITLSWDSTATGSLSGTTSDSGFVGLQNDGELTNTQQDLSFFNPNVSSSFNAFLAAH